MLKNKDFSQKLTNNGVLFKGFGLTYKFIMQDNTLPLESKAIYSYFASFAGNKDSAFPKLKTILSDLNLSKKGYYPHFEKLVEHGYISVKKSKGLFSHNIYTLNNYPEKFQNYARQNKKDYTHIKDYGYGMIPKAVMIDSRLDIKAKGLYAYLASVGGAAKVACRCQSQLIRHLKICTKTYYTYYNQLLNLNYITVEQQRTPRNRYGVNRYTLSQHPDKDNMQKYSVVKNQKLRTAKIEALKTESANLEYGKKDTITNINYSNKIKTFNKTKKSSSATNSLDDEIRILKDNLDYDNNITMYSDSKENIDRSIQFCAEILAFNKETFVIGSSCFQKESFRNAVNTLSIPCIANVLDKINKTGTVITNIKNYIVTSLYNQAVNPSSHFQNKIELESSSFDLDDFFEKAVARGMKPVREAEVF